jgi:Fis family transcriptional regulator
MKPNALQAHAENDSGRKGFGNGFLLSEHVRIAVENYFVQIDGHPVSDLYAMVIGEVERPLIEAVLEHAQRNQSRAAKVLGLSRSTLRKKMTLHGLE